MQRKQRALNTLELTERDGQAVHGALDKALHPAGLEPATL
jgi:hypothetical protein